MTDKNTKNPFKLISGGLCETAADSSKEFLYATITDTRLMGVVSIRATWRLPENNNMTYLHQYFYFDAEEYGFDTYKSRLGDGSEVDLAAASRIESSMTGGLGGKQIKLTEREVRYMVQSYAELNLRSGLELPEGVDEYDFLLSPQVNLTEAEAYVLMCKQCPVINSPYQVINYFLMRCFSRDFGAAKFLTKGYVRTDLFPKHKGATLLRNVIDEADDAVSGSNTQYMQTGDDDTFATFNTLKSYMCESLIEYDGQYFLLITQITLDHLKVVRYEKISEFKVSTAEATMMTAKPEIISVVDMFDTAPPFTRETTELAAHSITSDYENGRLFMIFQTHNDHVKKSTYLLNDDVLGLYYVVDGNQILLVAHSIQNSKILEKDLLQSNMQPYLMPISKYEFPEPVLFDFINSKFDDFEDFVVTLFHLPEE